MYREDLQSFIFDDDALIYFNFSIKICKIAILFRVNIYSRFGLKY